MGPSIGEPGASARGKRPPIRRRVAIVLSLVAVLASLAGPAEAWTLRIRTDGNDNPRRADIRRVVTDLSTSTVLFRIDTWQRFYVRGPQSGYFIVRFDSGGDRELDRVLEIYPGPRGYTCLLEEAEPGEIQRISSVTVTLGVRTSDPSSAGSRVRGSLGSTGRCASTLSRQIATRSIERRTRACTSGCDQRILTCTYRLRSRWPRAWRRGPRCPPHRRGRSDARAPLEGCLR